MYAYIPDCPPPGLPDIFVENDPGDVQEGDPLLIGVEQGVVEQGGGAEAAGGEQPHVERRDQGLHPKLSTGFVGQRGRRMPYTWSLLSSGMESGANFSPKTLMSSS